MSENIDKIEVVEPQIESKTSEQTTQEPRKYSEVELRAIDQGWVPKEEWTGSEEDWRPARDYVERGEMIGKIRSLTQQSKQFEQAVRHITAQNQAVFVKGYEKAIQEMKQARREALAEQDLVKAEEISEKIEEVKEMQTQALQESVKPALIAQGPDPEHVEWVAHNPWYNHPVMRNFADALAKQFIIENNGQVSPTQVRQYVSETVRQEFGHRFASSQRRTTAPPNPDSSGNRANSNGKANASGLTTRLSKIKAEMPEEHRQIMKTIIRASGMTEAEYLEQYGS
jgi:hypothetical protein